MENETIDFEYADSLVVYFGSLIKNGIIYHNTKIPFTMLDYFSVTDININSLASVIRKKKIERTHINSMYKNAFLYFVQLEGRLICEVNDADVILKQNNIFIVNGEKYLPTKNDVEEIFTILDENSIPKDSRLIYNALHRKALNCPVLPLKNIKEKKLSLKI